MRSERDRRGDRQRPFRSEIQAGKIRGHLSQKDFKDSGTEAAGQKITVPSAPKRGKVIDLMSALKESLEARGKKNKAKEEESAAGGGGANGDNRVHISRHTKSRRARS
jgi:hypothetical protein